MRTNEELRTQLSVVNSWLQKKYKQILGADIQIEIESTNFFSNRKCESDEYEKEIIWIGDIEELPFRFGFLIATTIEKQLNLILQTVEAGDYKPILDVELANLVFKY